MKPLLIIASLVGIDQLVKRLVVIYLKNSPPLQITPFLSLTYLENRGAAFGILQGARWFFVIITLIILAVLFKTYKNTSDKYMKLSIILIAAGGLGNFTDRLLFGFVIDYIRLTFVNFPVFNFADMLITTGAVIFGITGIFAEEKPSGDKT